MFLAVAVLCGLAFACISDLTLFQAPHTPYALPATGCFSCHSSMTLLF